MEPRRHLGTQRRPVSRRGRTGARRCNIHVASVRPPRRRPRGGVVRGRPRPPRQGGSLPVQLPGISREHVRHVQSRPGADQHQLPLHRRRIDVPVDQRRCGRGRVPRQLHRAVRRHARQGACCSPVDLGRRWHRAVPPLGDRLRNRSSVGNFPHRRPVGAFARRSLHPVHRWHHGVAKRRDVASRRFGRQPGRAVQAPASRCTWMG